MQAMIKSQYNLDDDALLEELGVEVNHKQDTTDTPEEQRIIAGFEEIKYFVEQHQRLPEQGEDKDLFERLYAVRLDKIRATNEYKTLLEPQDANGLLQATTMLADPLTNAMDDEKLLTALGVDSNDSNNITTLTHVKTRRDRKAAEWIAQRTPCADFDQFKSLFVKVQDDLKSAVRQSRRFKKDTKICQGEFFILGGQIVYVAVVGQEIKASNGAADARLRVICDNGTESDLLMRSLQRALYKDAAGRRITEPYAGPLFSDEQEEDDIESGIIYVLRSQSERPELKKNNEVLHKIGVTGGNLNKRIANAKDDPTFLMADVIIAASYQLSNINRVKLEKLIHKFFEPARLNIEIKDRFGKPIAPREWFLVPLFIIDEAVNYIKQGIIVHYAYDPKTGTIIKQKKDH